MKLDQLLVATGNEGKVQELRGLLSARSIELVLLSNFPNILPVEETGSTFRENAELKAAGYSSATGLYAVADDSGLEVAALKGRPGVLSARYGGDDLCDRERIDIVLNEMSLKPDVPRTARLFRQFHLRIQAEVSSSRVKANAAERSFTSQGEWAALDTIRSSCPMDFPKHLVSYL